MTPGAHGIHVGWPIRVASLTPGVWRTPAVRQILVAWPIRAGH